MKWSFVADFCYSTKIVAVYLGPSAVEFGYTDHESVYCKAYQKCTEHITLASKVKQTTRS